MRSSTSSRYRAECRELKPCGTQILSRRCFTRKAKAIVRLGLFVPLRLSCLAPTASCRNKPHVTLPRSSGRLLSNPLMPGSSSALRRMSSPLKARVQALTLRSSSGKGSSPLRRPRRLGKRCSSKHNTHILKQTQTYILYILYIHTRFTCPVLPRGQPTTSSHCPRISLCNP